MHYTHAHVFYRYTFSQYGLLDVDRVELHAFAISFNFLNLSDMTNPS